MSTFEENQDGERQAQEHLDDFYESKGWVPHRENASKQFDVELEVSGTRVAVEEKCLKWKGADEALLIEVVQDLWRPDKGWFHRLECNHLFWAPCDQYWKPTGLYTVHWDGLKQWLPDLLENGKKGKHWRWMECSNGYGYTVNVRVPWDVIPGSLYNHFEHIDGLPF